MLSLTTRFIRARGAKSNAILNGIKSRTVSKSQKNAKTLTVPYSGQATSRGFGSGHHTFRNRLYRLQSHDLKGTQWFIVQTPDSTQFPRRQTLPISFVPFHGYCMHIQANKHTSSSPFFAQMVTHHICSSTLYAFLLKNRS